MIKTIYYDDTVVILDQNKLPAQIKYIKCQTHEEIARAIIELKVRGAPLIGVAAAFALAVAIKNFTGSWQDIDDYFQRARDLLAATRPTAVNLFWAINRMDRVYRQNRNLSLEELTAAMLSEAQLILNEDVQICKAIGDHGQVLLPDMSRVMTICNAGALATCGYGTALGIIRSAHNQGKIKQVWACETRPVLQGSRLTVWELLQDKIPVTLITDSMAAYVMSQKRIDAVVVGADRIAANGDTANKIGTYALAVLAKYHDIPFYVAAPLSTIDTSISAGYDIPIEERNPEEVRRISGQYITVADVDVYNPAFDVTPADLISAIINEQGIITPPFDKGLKAIKEGR